MCEIGVEGWMGLTLTDDSCQVKRKRALLGSNHAEDRIGRPHALKIPTRTAEYSLTESALSIPG